MAGDYPMCSTSQELAAKDVFKDYFFSQVRTVGVESKRMLMQNEIHEKDVTTFQFE